MDGTALFFLHTAYCFLPTDIISSTVLQIEHIDLKFNIKVSSFSVFPAYPLPAAGRHYWVRTGGRDCIITIQRRSKNGSVVTN